MNAAHALLGLMLSRWIHIGTLVVRYPGGQRTTYGNGSSPRAGLAINTGDAARRLALNPSLALGECYMDGEIHPLDCSLHELLDLIFLNAGSKQHRVEPCLETVRWLGRRLAQLNSLQRSRRNVAHHYDLDGRLYSRLLDDDRQYSCAYFPQGDETLAEAQPLKKRHTAAKLHLHRPDLEVLDIGSGWGGMALYLAREH